MFLISRAERWVLVVELLALPSPSLHFLWSTDTCDPDDDAEGVEAIVGIGLDSIEEDCKGLNTNGH